MTLPRLYTVSEVASYLGVAVDTVYRAITDGRLRAARIGRKEVYRVTERALLEFLGEVPREGDEK